VLIFSIEFDFETLITFVETSGRIENVLSRNISHLLLLKRRLEVGYL